MIRNDNDNDNDDDRYIDTARSFNNKKGDRHAKRWEVEELDSVVLGDLLALRLGSTPNIYKQVVIENSGSVILMYYIGWTL